MRALVFLKKIALLYKVFCLWQSIGRIDKARMAELVDALASGASLRKGVGVRVPLRAHLKTPS